MNEMLFDNSKSSFEKIEFRKNVNLQEQTFKRALFNYILKKINDQKLKVDIKQLDSIFEWWKLKFDFLVGIPAG